MGIGSITDSLSALKEPVRTFQMLFEAVDELDGHRTQFNVVTAVKRFFPHTSAPELVPG